MWLLQAPGEIESKLGPLKSNVGPEAPRKSLEESTLRAVKESLPLHAVPPATSPSRSKPAKQLVSLKIATDTSPAGSVAVSTLCSAMLCCAEPALILSSL